MTVTDPDVTVVFAGPLAFVPTTENVYEVFEANPSNIYDVEDVPVSTVYVEGVVVIVYDVAAGEFAGRFQVSDAAAPVPAADAADVVLAVPKYGLLVPTSVTDRSVIANGSKKSLDCAECLPALLLISYPIRHIYYTIFFYAVRSP